jgi:hypothetical protein
MPPSKMVSRPPPPPLMKIEPFPPPPPPRTTPPLPLDPLLPPVPERSGRASDDEQPTASAVSVKSVKRW